MKRGRKSQFSYRKNKEKKENLLATFHFFPFLKHGNTKSLNSNSQLPVSKKRSIFITNATMLNGKHTNLGQAMGLV